MEETIGDWWMDARTNWHRGRPQAGWWQADDGRWHAPDDDDGYDDYDEDDPTGEIEGRPPAGAAHFAGEWPSEDLERGWGRSRWARSAVLALLAIFAVVLVGVAAMIDSGPDENQTGTTTTTVVAGAVPLGPGPQVPQNVLRDPPDADDRPCQHLIRRAVDADLA